MDKQKIMLVVVLCLGFKWASGQDFKKAAAESRQVYEKLEKLHAVIEVQVFESELSKLPFYKQTADIKKDNQNYLYMFGSNELLVNNTYMVLVDKDAKEINYSFYDPKEINKVFKDPIKLNYDSVFQQYGSPSYLGKEAKLDHYSITQKEGPIAKTDIYLHSESKLIERIIYEYREGQRATVIFLVFDQHPVFAPGVFSETRYFSKQKGKAPMASAMFKGFNISSVENK